MGARLTVAVVALTVLALPPPAAGGEAAVGVTSDQQLVRFDTAAPGAMLGSRPVTGLGVGETVAGIDVRPRTGQIFALTSINRVGLLDPASGALTETGAAIDAAILAPGSFPGIDFNPTVDRLRLVNPGNDNLRYNPVTFAPVDGDVVAPGVQGDTDLAFKPGDPNAGVDPAVDSVAYDRSDVDAATPTTVFGIDVGLNALVRLGAVNGDGADTEGGGTPNGGRLTTIGSLGIDVADTSLDIASPLGAPNVAYAATRAAGATESVLRTVNLATGAATEVGALPVQLTAFTILPGGSFTAVAPPPAAESAPTAVVRVERSGDSLAAAKVEFETVDGSAVAGQDYTARSGTLSFAYGERSENVAVGLRDDDAAEGTEAFALGLSRATDGSIVDGPAAIVRITDDDTKPILIALASAPSSLGALRSAGRLPVSFGVDEASRISFTLKLGSRKLGQASRQLTGPGQGRLNVRISGIGRRALDSTLRRGGSRSVRLLLLGTAVDDDGNRATTRQRLTLPRR